MLAAAVVLLAASGMAHAEILVAVVGDSNVNGKGVSRDQAYPAKLERALKAKGRDVRVLNSGINGDTTTGLMSRLDSAAPPDTKVAVVWIGINDFKRGVPREKIRSNVDEISNRLKKRGIQVVVIRTPEHADLFKKYLIPGDPEKHITPAGYDVLVKRTLGQVDQAIGRVKK
jgi:acyl-CoA thioesterase-1